MTRLALNDEATVMNLLSEMESDLYFGRINSKDVGKLIKTARGLLIELHLTRSSLDEDESDDLNTRILAAHSKNYAMQMFESNKPI